MKPNDAELVVMFFLFIFALLLGFGLYVLSSNSPSFSEIFAGRKTSLIYLFTGFVSATIILVLALSSRPRKRTSKLEGLVSGYGCSDFRFRPMFPSDLLPSSFEGMWECCLLGQGGWGSAYLCRRGEVKVVLKVPKGFELLIEESDGDKPSGGTSKELMKELMEEKELMEKLEKVKYEAEAISKLDHPNIIKLLGYSERAPLLIYEYADYGTLRWQLSKRWKPSQKDILLIGVELSDALRYIHSRGLVHGDIKPGNVFIKDGVIKLGDFSSIVMTLSSKSPSEIPATKGFRAPEQVYDVLSERAKKEGYENRIDVYQLANLILYMLIGESIDGEYAIDGKHVKEKLNKVRNKELRKILAEALVLEPSKRPSSEELSKAFKTLYKIYEKTT